MNIEKLKDNSIDKEIKIEFENFSEKENKKLIRKGGKIINNIFNSLYKQLGK